MVIHRAEILRRIQGAIDANGSLNRAAASLSVSPQLLSAVLDGKRNIGPRLLRALKLRRTIVKTITYEEAR